MEKVERKRKGREKEYDHEWQKKNGPRRDRRRRYGLSGIEYAALMQRHPVCAICWQAFHGAHPDGLTGEPQVDHDHDTGEVRALLCRRCNTGLGMFFDNAELLRRAYLYLHGLRDYV